ncbi:hypothetical protein ACOSP7_008845 [Xanthoceras sorbifolium]
MLSITVHFLFINQNIVTAIKNNDKVSLIRKSCKGTDIPDTCISILDVDPHCRAAVNFKSLTRVSIDIVYEDAIGLVLLFTKAEENATDHFLK